jgi:SAM-dependent methyltransferase
MPARGRTQAQVFGEVAEDFDRVRVPYPAELLDDVFDYVGRGEPGRLALEVGAGTGKATVAFAARELRVVALEPDPAMAAVLARNVKDLAGVEIQRATFEEYSPDEQFDLLYCADAWHWTRPDTRWPMAARALRPGGVLALFWNNDRIERPDQRRSMVDTFAALAPTIVLHDEPTEEQQMYAEWPGTELIQRGEFTDHVGHVYKSHRTLSSAEYLTLASTRSQVRMLPEPTRLRVLTALGDVLDDPVRLAIDTILYLARRA